MPQQDAIEDIRFARPDVALVSLAKRMSDDSEVSWDESEFPNQAQLTVVLVRDDGTWRIAVSQTTPKYNFDPVAA